MNQRRAANRSKGDAQQMEKLAAAPSGWRILNLYRTMRMVPHGSTPPGFFTNKRLSNSIIIKHTLREHERGTFDRSPLVATKVLVPLDETSMGAGAISFFVNERSYPAIMSQMFGINALPGRPLSRDAQILAKLDESPSLDVFLLRELLAGQELGIDDSYFRISLLEDTTIRAYITRELAPLIGIAAAKADEATVNRFVDSIFGSRIGPQAADFFHSLALPPDSWADVVFAWKAALYYETQLAELKRRFETLRTDLHVLRTYGHNENYPRSLVERQIEELKAAVDRSFARCLEGSQHFDSERRAAIIRGGQVIELVRYLRNLPESIKGFGGHRAVLDHILSYWAFRTRGLDLSRMPAEPFCSIGWDICAIERQFAGSDLYSSAMRA